MARARVWAHGLGPGLGPGPNSCFCSKMHPKIYMILGMNWVAVRAFGASIAGNCMKFRPESNGNIPGPQKSTKKLKIIN